MHYYVVITRVDVAISVSVTVNVSTMTTVIVVTINIAANSLTVDFLSSDSFIGFLLIFMYFIVIIYHITMLFARFIHIVNSGLWIIAFMYIFNGFFDVDKCFGRSEREVHFCD